MRRTMISSRTRRWTRTKNAASLIARALDMTTGWAMILREHGPVFFRLDTWLLAGLELKGRSRLDAGLASCDREVLVFTGEYCWCDGVGATQIAYGYGCHGMGENTRPINSWVWVCLFISGLLSSRSSRRIHQHATPVCSGSFNCHGPHSAGVDCLPGISHAREPPHISMSSD